MEMQSRIETKRLLLRPFELSDSKRVHKLAGNSKIAETTLSIPHPYEDGMAEGWISTHKENLINNKGITYAIVKKDGNELIGAIGLTFNNIHKKAELGYWIGVPYWNKGYCTEASKVIIELGFREFDLNKIYARALVSNTGSWTVMEKAGMKYEGTLRHEVVKDGIPLDLKIYAILREDLSNLKRAYIGIKYHEDYRNKSVIDKISSSLESMGYKTSCIVSDMANQREGKYSSRELMELTFKEIDRCDLVIIDLSEKGVGLGIEAGYAFAKGIPIITIAKQGSDISETLEGISKGVYLYKDNSDIDKILKDLYFAK